MQKKVVAFRENYEQYVKCLSGWMDEFNLFIRSCFKNDIVQYNRPVVAGKTINDDLMEFFVGDSKTPSIVRSRMTGGGLFQDPLSEMISKMDSWVTRFSLDEPLTDIDDENIKEFKHLSQEDALGLYTKKILGFKCRLETIFDNKDQWFNGDAFKKEDLSPLLSSYAWIGIDAVLSCLEEAPLVLPGINHMTPAVLKDLQDSLASTDIGTLVDIGSKELDAIQSASPACKNYTAYGISQRRQRLDQFNQNELMNKTQSTLLSFLENPDSTSLDRGLAEISSAGLTSGNEKLLLIWYNSKYHLQQQISSASAKGASDGASLTEEECKAAYEEVINRVGMNKAGRGLSLALKAHCTKEQIAQLEAHEAAIDEVVSAGK